jgi:hypothetical protein
VKQVKYYEDRVVIGNSVNYATLQFFKGYITVTQFSDGFIAAETRVSGEDLEFLIMALAASNKHK